MCGGLGGGADKSGDWRKIGLLLLSEVINSGRVSKWILEEDTAYKQGH